jgi:hypothetical protein
VNPPAAANLRRSSAADGIAGVDDCLDETGNRPVNQPTAIPRAPTSKRWRFSGCSAPGSFPARRMTTRAGSLPTARLERSLDMGSPGPCCSASLLWPRFKRSALRSAASPVAALPAICAGTTHLGRCGLSAALDRCECDQPWCGSRSNGCRSRTDGERPRTSLYLGIRRGFRPAAGVMSYDRCAATLKWATLSLFAYVAVVFAAKVPWGTAFYGTLVPSLSFDGAHAMALVAVLGTTISPYLSSGKPVRRWKSCTAGK